MKPTIGTTEAGTPLAIDIKRLLVTRMLVQADPGGGKSWALRRLLEQTAGHVQQIILDVEGEFVTLREKFDYVICAPQGADAIANPQTAAILARRLRETRVSAIIDMYELKMHDRKKFVRLFLEELIEAPKSMWHPALVLIDEAHLFAPEKDEAESLSAIIDLNSRGRKRGLCGVLATQRLSKLNKDAAAGLQNKLIGITTLDLDVARAADELSMRSKKEAMPVLRNLAPGEFYCFGPALSREIVKVKVGKVETTHPEAGAGAILTPPAPSEKIKALLAKLTDLPKEAEQEARTLADYKRENANLKRELTLARKEQKTETQEIEVPVLDGKHAVAVENAAEAIKAAVNKLRDLQTEWYSGIAKLIGEAADISASLARTTRGMYSTTAPKSVSDVTAAIRKAAPHLVRNAREIKKMRDDFEASSAPGDPDIMRPQQNILNALASFAQIGVTSVPKNMLAMYAGASPRSSAYKNNLGRLRSLGMIDYPAADRVGLTQTGWQRISGVEIPASNGEVHEKWYEMLPRPQAAILKAIIDIYPDVADRESLAITVGASPTSSAYKNNLGALRSLGAIDYPQKDHVRATELMFPIP